MRLLVAIFLAGCTGAETQTVPVEQPRNTAIYEMDDVPIKQAASEQKNAVAKEQQKTITLQEAYAQLQADMNRHVEESRQQSVLEQQEQKLQADRETEECSKSRECVAQSVCWRVEQNKMWHRAINDEMHNPAGVVDMRRLHEYGVAIQENDYYVKQNLMGTKFTVAELCKS